MRHRSKGRALSRPAGHRRALLRNLVTSLFEHGQVTTTVAKAKEARPVAERLITLAKRGGLHSRRLAGSYLRSDDVNKRLFDTIAPWYAERPGGYTRIIRVGRRLGDGGELGILSLIRTAEQMGDGGGTAGTAETAEPGRKRRFPALRRKKEPQAATAEAGASAGRKKPGKTAAPARKTGSSRAAPPRAESASKTGKARPGKARGRGRAGKAD